VSVKLRATGTEVRLDVIDQGAGFDPDALGQPRGLGLISMKERLNLVDGEIRIESRPGAGTTVHVRVPVAFREEDQRRWQTTM
jgi:signal transduction histidine kinase